MKKIQIGRWLIAGSLALGLGIGGQGRAEDSPLPKEAQELLGKAENARSYRIRFVLEAKEEDGSLAQVEGLLSFEQPNRRRLELRTKGQEGDSQMIVSDGTSEWQYYPLTNTVYRLESPPVTPGPHRAFAEVSGGTLRFIQRLSKNQVALRRFEAIPLPVVVEGSPVPIKALRVDVAEEDGFVRELVLLDEKGETVLTQRYHDLELNPNLAKETFEFTPPEGAQVVELGAGGEPVKEEANR